MASFSDLPYDADSVIIKVVSSVLDKLINGCKIHPLNQVTFLKFQSSYAPDVSIFSYLDRIRKYSRCSDSCFIMTLIYIDRLIERKQLMLTTLNVHRLLITCVMLAAKYHDDLFYNNAYYSKLGGLTLSELNFLEVELLKQMEFSLFIHVDAFTKYALELRNYGYSVDIVPMQPSPVSVTSSNSPLAHNMTPNMSQNLSNNMYSLTAEHLQQQQVSQLYAPFTQNMNNTMGIASVLYGNQMINITDPYMQQTQQSQPQQLNFLSHNADSLSSLFGMHTESVGVYGGISNQYSQQQYHEIPSPHNPHDNTATNLITNSEYYFGGYALLNGAHAMSTNRNNSQFNFQSPAVTNDFTMNGQLIRNDSDCWSEDYATRLSLSKSHSNSNHGSNGMLYLHSGNNSATKLQQQQQQQFGLNYSQTQPPPLRVAYPCDNSVVNQSPTTMMMNNSRYSHDNHSAVCGENGLFIECDQNRLSPTPLMHMGVGSQQQLYNQQTSLQQANYPYHTSQAQLQQQQMRGVNGIPMQRGHSCPIVSNNQQYQPHMLHSAPVTPSDYHRSSSTNNIPSHSATMQMNPSSGMHSRHMMTSPLFGSNFGQVQSNLGSNFGQIITPRSAQKQHEWLLMNNVSQNMSQFNRQQQAQQQQSMLFGYSGGVQQQQTQFSPQNQFGMYHQAHLQQASNNLDGSGYFTSSAHTTHSNSNYSLNIPSTVNMHTPVANVANGMDFTPFSTTNSFDDQDDYFSNENLSFSNDNADFYDQPYVINYPQQQRSGNVKQQSQQQQMQMQQAQNDQAYNMPALIDIHGKYYAPSNY